MFMPYVPEFVSEIDPENGLHMLKCGGGIKRDASNKLQRTCAEINIRSTVFQVSFLDGKAKTNLRQILSISEARQLAHSLLNVADAVEKEWAEVDKDDPNFEE